MLRGPLGSFMADTVDFEIDRNVAMLISLRRMDLVVREFGARQPNLVRTAMRRRLRRHWHDDTIRVRAAGDHSVAKIGACDALRSEWGGQIFLWSSLLWFLSSGRGTREGLDEAMYSQLVKVGEGGESHEVRQALEAIDLAPTDAWEQSVIADPMSVWNDLLGIKADADSLLRTLVFAAAWRPVEESFSDDAVAAAHAWAARQAHALAWGPVELEFPRLRQSRLLSHI